uniref:Uncharacterized protein LOC8271592 n=1 Tax=Rhizophora mucronata TaxID=61149 RepID=A0A2P2JDK4_RHIMU
MEVSMEFEDDLFFAELSKQISLLLIEDDEDPTALPTVSFQGSSGGNYATAPSPFWYQKTCRRESKGTGVFIPQSFQPRRKHRQGSHGSYNSKSHRQHDNTRMVSKVSHDNNSFKPNKG